MLAGELSKYDWLHLHHEDFTGQYGKFYAAYQYGRLVQGAEGALRTAAAEQGFATVSDQKKASAAVIKEYVVRGGFLFSMCSATDSFDIGLAAAGVDICDAAFDGDAAGPPLSGEARLHEVPRVRGLQAHHEPARCTSSPTST